MPLSWVPEGNTVLPTDNEARAAAKWCAQLIDAKGNRPSKFPEGCIPLASDDLDRLLVKIDILSNS